MSAEVKRTDKRKPLARSRLVTVTETKSVMDEVAYVLKDSTAGCPSP